MINRRTFLNTMKHCAVFSGLTGLACADARDQRPNILLIVADDLGYEMLGCYGGLETDTPNLDSMAKNGVMFTRAYTSPVCTPSRMSLYTGTYMPRHQFSSVLPIHVGSDIAVDMQEWPTYAQALRAAGYATSVTGKWQLAGLEFHPDHCRQAGFDSWCVWQIWKDGAKTTRYWQPVFNQDGEIRQDIDDQFGPDVLTGYVIEQMRSAQKANKPFCIQHNMLLPHVPLVQTPDDKKANCPASLKNMVRYLDKQVGKLLTALDELDLTENTFVFFVGDNGTQAEKPRMTTAGKITGGKWTLTDAGTHVPFIAFSPNLIPSGRRLDDLIDMADFFPTICELAGVKILPKNGIDGVSFVRPLTGRGRGTRPRVTAGIGDDFFIFDGDWRLHHRGEKLVDCRELPEEKRADMNSEAAEAAKARLLPDLNELRRLWNQDKQIDRSRSCSDHQAAP